MSEAEVETAQPARKSGSKLPILIVALVLLLGGGGGGAYWWFAIHAKAADAEAAEEDHDNAGMVTLEPFVVNLADPEARRVRRPGRARPRARGPRARASPSGFRGPRVPSGSPV